MSIGDFEGKLALVTGASSGLGRDFARLLGKVGANLVLVARNQKAMEELALEIQAARKEQGFQELKIVAISMDLSLPGAALSLKQETDRKGLNIDVLINNAGFGSHGSFDEIPWEKEESMLQLDIITLVALTKIYAVDMKKRGWGRILQIASVGAFQPAPGYASYAAAKSFVLNYGLAINYELRASGVSCTVLSPGVTATRFLEVAEQAPTPYQKLFMMQSEKVASIGLKALARRRKTVVPGFGNKFNAVLTRFIGRGFAAALAHRLAG